MTPANFKKIRQNITQLIHHHSPAGKFIAVTLNNTYHQAGHSPTRRRKYNLLTPKQLQYFEYLPSIDIDAYYNKGVNL